MKNTPYGHSIIVTELLTWVQGRLGLVALHDRVQTTTTTSDGKTFTGNKVQRHGCYQPSPMKNTPYGHSIIITEILTWVQGRLGLVALHDRVQTTTTTSDGKTFTANKVQRHGCYHTTPMGNTANRHSILMIEILTWVPGRLRLVALHDRVQTTTTTSDGKTFTANKVQRHGCYHPTFFSHFHLKNARFSAISAQKMHVFQSLPPEKGTFFSHFCLKNARFSCHFKVFDAHIASN
jgi:hypothetical protein